MLCWEGAGTCGLQPRLYRWLSGLFLFTGEFGPQLQCHRCKRSGAGPLDRLYLQCCQSGAREVHTRLVHLLRAETVQLLHVLVV